MRIKEVQMKKYAEKFSVMGRVMPETKAYLEQNHIDVGLLIDKAIQNVKYCERKAFLDSKKQLIKR
jgi:hypothetical protein